MCEIGQTRALVISLPAPGADHRGSLGLPMATTGWRFEHAGRRRTADIDLAWVARIIMEG